MTAAGNVRVQQIFRVCESRGVRAWCACCALGGCSPAPARMPSPPGAASAAAACSRSAACSLSPMIFSSSTSRTYSCAAYKHFVRAALLGWISPESSSSVSCVYLDGEQSLSCVCAAAGSVFMITFCKSESPHAATYSYQGLPASRQPQLGSCCCACIIEHL